MAYTASVLPVVFTSWKEIASYLNKGIRTVQRWESKFDLPVQRPNKKEKGTVLISREELDRWLATRWSKGDRNEVGQLRARVAELARQNAELRRAVAKREAARLADGCDGDAEEINLLWLRCDWILQQTELVRREFRETLDRTQNLKVLRELGCQYKESPGSSGKSHGSSGQG